VRPSWSQTATPRRPEGLGAGWGQWTDNSQSFIPARLQEPAEGKTGQEEVTAGSRQLQIDVEPQVDVLVEPIERDATDEAMAQAASALIRKASAENGEAIMAEEAASLEPLRALQAGAERGQRALARLEAQRAMAEEARKKQEAAVAVAEDKERALEAKGFVRKDASETQSEQPSTEDVATTAAEEEAAEAAEANARADSYTAQSFSPIRDTFAGARGASWGGMDPVGYQPVTYMGYKVAGAAEVHDRTASAAAAEMRARQPSLDDQGFVPNFFAPGSARAAAFASQHAHTAAGRDATSAVAEFPYHTQGFPSFQRDKNLGWGDEAVSYSPLERGGKAR